jgi:lipopolysaccharide transport system ATP-binding protein
LAFAVAAHLEPEIMVVDEVLAVGDAQFQKKCLGKMREVGEGGRTVLFVSHNMAAISSLCERIVVLKSGKISFEGDVEIGIDHYLDVADHRKGFNSLQNTKSNDRKQPQSFSKLLSVETLNSDDKRQSLFKMGGSLRIKLRLEITDSRKDIELIIAIRNSREIILGVLLNTAEGFKNIQKGINDIQIDIPEINLMPGEYRLAIGIFHQNQPDSSYVNAIDIDIYSDNFTGNYVDYTRFKEYGSIIRSNWKTLN